MESHKNAKKDSALNSTNRLGPTFTQGDKRTYLYILKIACIIDFIYLYIVW